MDFNLTKEQQLIILGLVVSIIIGLGVTVYKQFSQPEPGEVVIESNNFQNNDEKRGEIVAHVSGAVKKEGVYRLTYGDRVIEAIKMAGGATAKADLSVLNLAEVVKDGGKVYVPLKEAVQTNINEEKSAGQGKKIGGKVNINTADVKRLDTLPGIGPATAQAIVDYRREKGLFSAPEKLLGVPRLGKAKFEKLKEKITI